MTTCLRTCLTGMRNKKKLIHDSGWRVDRWWLAAFVVGADPCSYEGRRCLIEISHLDPSNMPVTCTKISNTVACLNRAISRCTTAEGRRHLNIMRQRPEQDFNVYCSEVGVDQCVAYRQQCLSKVNNLDRVNVSLMCNQLNEMTVCLNTSISKCTSEEGKRNLSESKFAIDIRLEATCSTNGCSIFDLTKCVPSNFSPETFFTDSVENCKLRLNVKACERFMSETKDTDHSKGKVVSVSVNFNVSVDFKSFYFNYNGDVQSAASGQRATLERSNARGVVVAFLISPWERRTHRVRHLKRRLQHVVHGRAPPSSNVAGGLKEETT
ncbi:hypothetical protein Btru_067872 [Bulinus truncatus]|nr:hypothetical protein Btru_067872 [Bulinus truncatus]